MHAANSELLEGAVLFGLAQVIVHFAGRREDALHTGGGKGRRQVLLGHLGELGPRRLLQLPAGEQIEVRVSVSSGADRYSSSSSRSGVAVGAGVAATFLPSSPASVTVLPPRDEGFVAAAGAGAGAGASTGAGAGAGAGAGVAVAASFCP